MKSVFYRPTGRLVIGGAKPDKKAFEIVRNNEIYAPEFLEGVDLQGRSLYVKGDRQNGVDFRMNATGDTADNATGYQIAIDTITYHVAGVVEQKFYKVAPAMYLPMVVGEGAFSSQLLFNRSYSVAEDFEAGNVQQGGADSRSSDADTAIDGVLQATQFWQKGVSYSLIEVEQALRANSWDPIILKHEARKKNWDLGIQATAFLGLSTDTRFPGLLTNTAFTTNSSVITKYIYTMSASEFATFLGACISAYWTNSNSTAMPNTFVVPQLEYNGLAQTYVPNVIAGGTGTYPITYLEYLKKAFSAAVQPYESSVEILPLSYADKTVNNSLRGLNLNYYMLYRKDPKSIRMNIPVDYTVTQAGTRDNFTFMDQAYGQYTGVVSLRNLETLRFTF